MTLTTNEWFLFSGVMLYTLMIFWIVFTAINAYVNKGSADLFIPFLFLAIPTYLIILGLR